MVLSILPSRAKQLIMNGQLPILSPANFFLRSNETCHYVDRAIYEKKIERKKRVRKSTGYSTKGFFKGSRIHFGNGTTDYVTDVSYAQIQGILYITSQRIAFVGEGEGFTYPIGSLVGINPYLNCVEFQFTKENHRIFVPDGNVVSQVLRSLH